MQRLMAYAGHKPTSIFGYVPRFGAQLLVIPVLAFIAVPLYINMVTGGRGLLAAIFGLPSQREVEALRREVVKWHLNAAVTGGS